MYPLSPPSESFITTAPWIFQVETIIDLPVSDVWNILNDDTAWELWQPEVTNIIWNNNNNNNNDRELNSERTLTFSDRLFNILLCGPVKLYEIFHEFERNKTLGLYIKGMNRPNFVTYKCFQEKFILEEVVSSEHQQCKLIRILALEPGFATRYILGCILYPYIKHHITKQCPDRLLKSIAAGKLPRQTTK